MLKYLNRDLIYNKSQIEKKLKPAPNSSRSQAYSDEGRYSTPMVKDAY